MPFQKTLAAALSTLFLFVVLPAHPASAASGKASTSGKSSKKRKHHDPVITGFQVPTSRLRAEPLPRPSGDLKLVSVNFRSETLDVNIYNEDGSFNEESLEKLYHFWRCRRTGTEKPINPHLFEILSIIYDHFQSPVELVSGFRNQEHQTSFHFHGSASDIRVTGVAPDVVHEFVQTLDAGGMGLGRYPRAQFVHVDVRPEPSYRWVDRSPPGGGDSHKKTKRRHNA